jgi:transposase
LSTSLLYHGFGIRDYKYLKTEYRKGAVIFHIKKDPDKWCCADCGSKHVRKKGHFVREIRTVPIGKKKVFLSVHLHRLKCRDCRSLELEPLIISFPKKQWTKSLGRCAVELLKRGTVEDAARHLGMSWDTVKEIHLRELKRKLKQLRYLGVDEIAVRRGHNYLTVVVDLETGQVVWVGEGRQCTSLGGFIRTLKRRRVELKAIAMDMWLAYIKAVSKYYPREVIVYDRYHLIQDCNRMLDELRREEASKVSLQERKEVYTGTRYLLLRGKEKLDTLPEAKEKLDRLLAFNESLNTAYILKEELRMLWECQSREEAVEYFDNWLQKAWSSDIELVVKFANKLLRHRNGILNYFHHRITTGQVEGINNKIKVLKRQAYGYRDKEYFKLRIYSLHEFRYALIDKPNN